MCFLFVFQGSASEATFLCLLAAKERMLRKVLEKRSNWDEGFIKGKMIAYSSGRFFFIYLKVVFNGSLSRSI